MQFFGRRAAREKISKRTADACNLIRRLVDKLKPEMPDPRRQPLGEMQARFLRLGSKHGIAATDVGHHRMRASAGIAQGDLVFLARPAAIAITGSGRKESAKNAVF